MALLAHPAQASYPTFSLKVKPLTGVVKLKPCVAFKLAGCSDHFMPLKHPFQLRNHPISCTKGKHLKVRSFKGNAQNGESDHKDSNRKFSKTTFQLPRTQNEKEMESSHIEKHPLPCTSEARGDTVTGSRAIQRLFRKWLIILRTQASSQSLGADIKKEQVQGEISGSQSKIFATKAAQMMKAAFMFFIGLDAAISLPLLIFMPWYLTIKVIYGADVVRELTPLWILGPLIVALYVKIIQWLCSLYVRLFVQTIRFAKNLPDYFQSVYSYLAEGKLIAYIWSHFWKPIIDIKSLDFGALIRGKLKQMKEWATEKYLDYVESIWPYYCRTIRFLKKANLI